jgi:hypothetical protein
MNSFNNQPKSSMRRASSLDALRGYAILTMVLSATIVYGILPAWMYHMQEPPPAHVFQPELSGLTWVDLVFPFFLFAMGAAFPFSIRKRFEKGESRWKLVYEALKRGVQLTFFAIFIQHFYPYMLSNPQDESAWLLAIACFAILFPMFMRIPLPLPGWAHTTIKLAAYGIAVGMMAFTDYAAEEHFSLFTSNIIILLLANMAIFGSIIYLFTMRNWLARIALLAALAGIVLSAQTEGSWVQTLYTYSPLPWMYRFEYLRYLFIVLPGSMAGDLLLKWMNHSAKSSDIDKEVETPRRVAYGVLAISVSIIFICLIGLYNRWSFLTFALSALLLIIGWWLVRKRQGSGVLWRELFLLGAALLLVGLCFEPFQGGIKKDGPTFGYLFVTAGLGCMALIAFHVICDYLHCRRGSSFLVMSGQNPMIAYVACDLLIYPLFNLLGITKWFGVFHISPWMGFLQGILLTAFALLVTMFFTKIKCFWRT